MQQVLWFDSAIYCRIIFMFPIFFKDITKNEENKTDQLTLNVTFNSVNNIIFYTLTEVQKHRRVVQKHNIQDTGP